jgi:hypothetical protein
LIKHDAVSSSGSSTSHGKMHQETKPVQYESYNRPSCSCGRCSFPLMRDRAQAQEPTFACDAAGGGEDYARKMRSIGQSVKE